MGDSNISIASQPQVKKITFVEVASQMSGVEFSTLYLAQHLSPSRWQSLVICPEEGDLPVRCREANLAVHIVRRPNFFSTSMRIGQVTFFNPLAVLYDVLACSVAAWQLTQFIRIEKPDLIVPKGLLAQFYGSLAARWAGVPCIWHIQDRVSDRAGGLYSTVLGIAVRNLARHVIVDADSIKQQLVPHLPSDYISVIWNGVDLEEFSPDVDGGHVRSEWKVGTNDILIGTMGRLTPWKGQHLLLRAFAKIANQFPQTCLVLIGSALFDTDTYANLLRSEAINLGIESRVIFAGFRSDTSQALAALDIFVHTSVEKDSSPLAVVSAMAMGKPIVCSAVDGTAQLFQEGVDGLLFPIGDIDALVERLARLVADANLRHSLGRGARAKAEHELSIEQFSHQCEMVFESVVQ